MQMERAAQRKMENRFCMCGTRTAFLSSCLQANAKLTRIPFAWAPVRPTAYKTFQRPIQFRKKIESITKTIYAVTRVRLFESV